MKTICILASIFFLSSLEGSLCYGQEKLKSISGYVTNFNDPLADINISVIGSSEGTRTNKKGRYEVKASPGDTLRFTHIGMNDIDIIVEDVTKILNIQMQSKLTALDEVTVTKKRVKSARELELEYHSNKSLVKSAYGIMNQRRSGFNTRIIDGDDLSPGGIDFLSSLEMNFNFNGRVVRQSVFNPGSRIIGPQVFFRRSMIGLRPAPAIFDLDGMILDEAPVGLAIANIDRIALLIGIGATNQYGPDGSGGVVVINTKGANPRPVPTSASGRFYADDSNIYDVNTGKNALTGSIPKYMQDFDVASSEKEANSIFQKYLKLYRNSPYFLLDVSDYFRKRWKNADRADSLLKETLEKCSSNAVVLKAAAYLYEEQGDFDTSNSIYKDVIRLRPRYAQSFRDLGNNYAATGAKKDAIHMYSRYMLSRNVAKSTVPLTGIDSIISTEINTLMSSEKLPATKLTTAGGDIPFVWPKRVVIEWNNSEAEFEMQFINPENRYYNWNHTLKDNPDRIADEKLKGYSSEQFLIDDSFTGQWKLNLKYFGNKGYDPTYFKFTTYTDYGTDTEEKSIEIFKISESNTNTQVVTINVTPAKLPY